MTKPIVPVPLTNGDSYPPSANSARLYDSPPSDGDQSPIHVFLRWKWRILLFASVFTAFAGLVIWNIPPRYTASSAVTIDARQVRMISPQQLLASQMLDDAQVRTFMEGFGTLRLAKAVVVNLGLNRVAEYCLEAKPLWDWREWRDRFVKHAATTSAQASCETSVEHAAEQLTQAVSASNDGRSYLIRIQAEAGDAVLATRIANAYADAYVADRLAKSREIAEEASSWLNTYVTKLSGQVMAADAAVARYRNAHHLIPLRGETLASQSLIELNSQISALNNEIDRKQSLLSQLGPNWSGGLTKDVAALNLRKDKMTSQLMDLQSRVGQQGDEDVRLQELLRNAESSRQIYQAALTRLKEIEVDQGIARSDAQIVSEATVPKSPSYPRKTMMLVGAFLSSLGVGAGLAFALSLQSRKFRDARHVESETGQPMLGIFPRPPGSGAPEDIAIDQPLSLEAGCLHKVLINLLGSRPERQGGSGKVVLLTSAAPGEGKTSYSVALGRSARRMGLSTVLLDCDMRRPAVVAMLPGLESPEAMSDSAERAKTGEHKEWDVAKGLLVDRDSGLHVIPLSAESSESPGLLLGAPAMRRILQDLRRKYDLILLDTPPLMAAMDALILTCLVDSVILLVDCQKTPRGAVAEAIDMLRRQGAPTSGVVLSKVDLRAYARMNGGYAYYTKYYRAQQTANADRRLLSKEKS